MTQLNTPFGSSAMRIQPQYHLPELRGGRVKLLLRKFHRLNFPIKSGLVGFVLYHIFGKCMTLFTVITLEHPSTQHIYYRIILFFFHEA